MKRSYLVCYKTSYEAADRSPVNEVSHNIFFDAESLNKDSVSMLFKRLQNLHGIGTTIGITNIIKMDDAGNETSIEQIS